MNNYDEIDVSIIYVVYKNTSLVEESIKTVVQYSQGFKYEIIVVDNSNDKETFDLLKSRINNATLIDANDNLGFGKGNNLGVEHAKGKYLFFLNNDTLLVNNAIYELFSFMEKNESCGACGPNLYTYDMKPNSSFSKKEWTLKRLKHVNSLFFLFKKNFIKRTAFFNYSAKNIELKGDIIGASLMIRHNLFDLLGGFDKDIFMYGEDRLLCHRVLKETKYKMYNIPSSKIIHFEGGSFKSQNSFQCKSLVDGEYIFYCKAYGYDIGKKYLLSMKKIYKKKMLLARILRKKLLIEKYNNFVIAYSKKIEEINDNHSGE